MFLFFADVTSCLKQEFDGAKDVNIKVEQEIVSDEQLEVVSNEDIKVPQKEKWPIHKRGPGGRSRCSNYPILDLSWVGNVIELKDGEIKVVWADGNISKVFFLLPTMSKSHNIYLFKTFTSCCL